MTQTLAYGAPDTVIHAMTNTDLASLAHNALSGLSSEIDNTVNKHTKCQIRVQLGSAAFVAGDRIDIYWMPSGDLAGGAYGTLGTLAQEALSNYYWTSIYIKGTTAAQDENSGPNLLDMPVGKGKMFVNPAINASALAASGNSIDIYTVPVTMV